MFFVNIVDGNWGQWEYWNACSKSCNGGSQNRSRLCDNPLANHGGAKCASNSSYLESTIKSGTQRQQDIQSCSEHPCPGELIRKII